MYFHNKCVFTIEINHYYRYFIYLDGGIVSTDVNNLTTHSDQHLLNKDAVVLKFQCGKLKNPLEISLTKNSVIP